MKKKQKPKRKAGKAKVPAGRKTGGQARLRNGRAHLRNGRAGRGRKKIAARIKKAASPLAAVKIQKPIGIVTHFYGGIKVVIAKFKTPVKLGARLRFRGATTDFEDVVQSMQYNHAPIAAAKKNQEVGIRVKKKAREGDEIFLVR
jgi:hypothetical protein